ncbi:hypothetical protein ALI144C_27370 [Actinosynnema sp. ALI-1.44]|nr:hypothetical protein ALI144C_27370 [Actinosynnema sp. ALI-1.44]
MPALLASMIALAGANGASARQENAAPPAACSSDPAPMPPQLTPTTIATIGQAYYCVFKNYVGGDQVNHRRLLASAFAGLTEELHRRQLDRTGATMPALSGNRDRDWVAFRAAYQQVIGQLPADPTLHQALAAATMRGMIESLRDNHAMWTRQEGPPPHYAIGLDLAPRAEMASWVPNEVTGPLFIRRILGGAAEQAGLLPGDIITSVNDAAPFVNGKPTPGVLDWLRNPSKEPVKLGLTRPVTGRSWTATLTPGRYEQNPDVIRNVTARRAAGDLAHVTVGAFVPQTANDIFRAVADLKQSGPINGIVLDLRRNMGGSGEEARRLLSAFVHHKTSSYKCDYNYNNCVPETTDDQVELLRLRLAVLTSRDCVSACDSFSGSVRDLGLGPIIGTRTGGFVSGLSYNYTLNDGTTLTLPRSMGLSANREIINGIGVAPDHYIPFTAEDLSAGRDPAIDKAATLLHL